MKVLVLAAMDKERRLLEPAVAGIKGHDIVVDVCGIGKVNAALHAAEAIRLHRPGLVVNSGVAGGVGGTRPGDVVAGARTAYHDVWCGPGTLEGQADGCPAAFEAPASVLSLLPAQVKRGVIATGDRFVATPAEVEAIRRVWPDAVAVDMESAAIAHACWRAGVPFLSLRVVSDTPGEHPDNAAQYTDFWDYAPRASFAVVKALLEALPDRLPA